MLGPHVPSTPRRQQPLSPSVPKRHLLLHYCHTVATTKDEIPSFPFTESAHCHTIFTFTCCLIACFPEITAMIESKPSTSGFITHRDRNLFLCPGFSFQEFALSLSVQTLSYVHLIISSHVDSPNIIYLLVNPRSYSSQLFLYQSFNRTCIILNYTFSG